MNRHERFDIARVESRYEVDTLGAPFKVIVLDCVTKKIDPETGKVFTTIPDLVGLIKAAVRARVTHPRKLNGEELKFVRNALGIKANVVASFFDMSPEHLSRCESGAKVMSSMTEKTYRLMMFLASFHPNPEELMLEAESGEEIAEDIQKNVKRPEQIAKKFVQHFLTMRIDAVYDAGEELCFEFSKEPLNPTDSDRLLDDDESEWEPKRVSCGGR